ncbi:MAG: serine protein kinase RIO [Pyrobaculum sp.]
MGRFRTEKDHDYFKVVDDAINSYTWAAVVKLQERKVVDEVLGPVGQGKEAKLVLAKRGGGYAVLKIFFPVAVRFVKSRRNYLLGDPRFRGMKVGDQLHLVETWCRKEFGNLARAYAAGVQVPRPFGFYRNVLAMEFIGSGTSPAPRLIDVGLENLDDVEQVFLEVVKNLEKTYIVAGLVHGDFSPFNILHDGEKPWVIDWGSAVRRGHPKELEYLRRDIENIFRFFRNPVDPVEFFRRLVERAGGRDVEIDREGWVVVGGKRILDN